MSDPYAIYQHPHDPYMRIAPPEPKRARPTKRESMIDCRPIPRLEVTMPVTREARYLSGNDRGKHVRLTVPGGKYTGPWELEGKLMRVTHWEDDTVSLHVIRENGPKAGTDIPANTIVTITGKAS